MEKEKLSQDILSKVDQNTLDQDEELAFIEYQENVNRSKEERRNRFVLIALSIAVYLLGLGLFATIVQTIYQMNNTAGIVVGIVLLVIYTICFIVVIIEIFAKHSFDLEFKKRQDGHFSERKNNKVRFEIAANITQQSSVLEYIEKKKQKETLSASEKERVASFDTIIILSRKYKGKTPFSNNPDSQTLADALSVAMRKDGIIYQKAKQMILKRAVTTGALTAISQNTAVDAGIVAVKNMQLIKDIIWLYGFRPSNGQVNKIMFRVVKSVCLAVGLNTLPKSASWAGKLFNKDSDNFLIQLFGQALDMGAQFLGNGAMTYLVGKYTIHALLSEYHLQDLFRIQSLQPYEMEMNEATVEVIDARVKEEVKKLSDKPQEKKLTDDVSLLEQPKKKRHFFDFLHRKKEKKGEKEHE